MSGNSQKEIVQTSDTIEGPLSVKSQNNILADYYLRYKITMRAYILAEFSNKLGDIDDVIQQVFLKFSEIKDLQTIKSPRSYLNRMARNIIISNFRQKTTREKYSTSIIENHFSLPRGCELTPERVYEGREGLYLVRQAIEKMPRKRRRMLLMKRIHGLSTAEIACRFGVSITCVNKHIVRATRDIALAISSIEDEITDD